MTLCDRMFEKFDALIGEDDKISKDDLMIVLKEELSDVSVFDLMIISAEIIENNKYVQKSYQEKSKKIYVDSFINRVNEIRSNDTVYDDYFNRDNFVEKLNETERTKVRLLVLWCPFTLHLCLMSLFILLELLSPDL